MTYHAPIRGILRASAATDPNALLGELTTAFASFKASHKADLDEIRAALADRDAQSAMAQMNRGPRPIGNRDDELQALAQFSRVGEVSASLSIGGSETGDLSKGGAAVFPEVSNQIRIRQFEQSALARLARRVTMATGDVFEEPQDLGQPGAEWVGETAARPPLDSPDFALLQVPLDEVYTNVKITQRLLDDSRYNLGGWLADRIADRLSRAAGAAFMSGNGTLKPTGILTAPVSADPDATRAWGTVQTFYTGAAGAFGTGAAGPDLLVDMVYSLAPRFRTGASWIMNSKTAGVIRKMRDGDGRLMWAESLAAGQPATLLGYPVQLDEFAPDIGAGSQAVLFGNFSEAYLIVERSGLRLLRDPYSDKPNVHFYAYQRVGGKLQDSEAVKSATFAVEP